MLVLLPKWKLRITEVPVPRGHPVSKRGNWNCGACAPRGLMELFEGTEDKGNKRALELILEADRMST